LRKKKFMKSEGRGKALEGDQAKMPGRVAQGGLFVGAANNLYQVREGYRSSLSTST